MNDLHIDALTYGVRSIGQHIVGYDAAEPFSLLVEDIGEFRIVQNELTVVLTVHCPDEQAARELVEPFLRAWEIHTDLTVGHGAIRFGFRSAAWRDLNPPEGSASFGFSDHVTISDSVEFRVRLSRYPEPPPDHIVAANDLVRDIHARWCQYQEDSEPLRGMANYVLTRIVLEAASASEPHPNHQTAARIFNISKRVLDEIAAAAALPGTGLAARKAYGPARGRFVAAAAEADEIEAIYSRVDAWLEDAIEKVMLHLARHHTTSPENQLKMADLFPLPARPTGRSLQSQ